jgi:hypothetical protein
MKKFLNPALIRQPLVKDPEVVFRGPPWVLLREPINENEMPIGRMEVSILDEPKDDAEEFRAALMETHRVLDEVFGKTPEAEPKVFMAMDAFGFDFPFRLIIKASKPFTP